MGLLILAIFGAIAAAIAHTKGRSVIGWFFGGFFLGLIGIIIIACLSNVREEKEYREHIAQDNRRLREKLEQERLKSEAFRQHVSGRLDVHDQHLGIETRSTPPPLASGNHVPALLDSPDELEPLSFEDEVSDVEPKTRGMTEGAPTMPPIPDHTAPRQWFYEQNGQSHGPVLEHELQQMFRARRLDSGTLVWTEPIGEWVLAERVSILKPYLQS